MSGLELAAFGTLWFVLALLACLVFILYRQVEKAYAASTELQNVGLQPGVEAPDVEVVAQDGTRLLRFPAPGGLAFLAFLTTSCEACVTLVRELQSGAPLPGPVIGLITGEDRGEFSGADRGRFHPLWVAHPPDVIRDYGIGTTPYVYVIRGRTILGSKSVEGLAGVRELLRDADAFEATRSDQGRQAQKSIINAPP
jgi:hypothetical protein